MVKTKQESIDKYKKIAIFSWAMLGVILLLAIVFLILYRLRSVFSLFIYTMAVVYLLRPIVSSLEKKKVPRILAVVITYIIFILVLALLLLYIIPIMIDQVQGFAKDLPSYIKAVKHYFIEYRGRLGRLHVPQEASKLVEQSLIGIKDALIGIAGKVPEVTLNLFSVLFYLILAPVIAFYILKDMGKIKETIVSFISKRHREEALTLINKINVVVSGFLRGQFLVALSVGFLSSMFLWVLGIKYPVLLGTATGILNLIPYFGPIAGGAMAALVAFFKAPIYAVWVIIGMFIIQQIDGLFLSPYIVGQQVNLHPALVIFALLIGGSLYGILGMLLAIPIAAAGKAILIHFQEKSA